MKYFNFVICCVALITLSLETVCAGEVISINADDFVQNQNDKALKSGLEPHDFCKSLIMGTCFRNRNCKIKLYPDINCITCRDHYKGKSFRSKKTQHCYDVARSDAVETTSKASGSHSLDRIIVFRVYGPDGAPLDKAEVRLRTNTSFVQIHPKAKRGQTVNGLKQTFVPCYSKFNPNWPSQIRYEWEIWHSAGKTKKGYWWQGTGGPTCDTTLDITVKLKPI